MAPLTARAQSPYHRLFDGTFVWIVEAHLTPDKPKDICFSTQQFPPQGPIAATVPFESKHHYFVQSQCDSPKDRNISMWGTLSSRPEFGTNVHNVGVINLVVPIHFRAVDHSAPNGAGYDTFDKTCPLSGSLGLLDNLYRATASSTLQYTSPADDWRKYTVVEMR